MQVAVEGDCVVELVDAEAVLGKAGNIRTEQPAAGRHDQPIVGEALPPTFDACDFHRARLGVDRLCDALHVDNVDGLEDILQRCRQRLWLLFVEPWANHQRRLWCNQRDLEFFRRSALDVAQAGSRKCSVHAGEAGAYDNKSHVIYSCG